MKKVNKKMLFSIALIILTIFTLTSSTFSVSNPDFYDPSQGAQSNNTSFLQKAGIILGWIQYIGILVSVIALTIIGIKYLFGSVEGKAEYKKTMLPYVIGCFLLMGASFVVGLIANIAEL